MTSDSPKFSYYVTLPISGEEESQRLDELVAEETWSLDEAASAAAPDPLQVVVFEEPEELLAREVPSRADRLHGELTSRGLQPAGILARYGDMRMIIPSIGPDGLPGFFGGSSSAGAAAGGEADAGGAPPPPEPPGGDDGNGEGGGKKPTSDTEGEAGSKEVKKDAKPAPATDPAATITAATAAFLDPAELWTHVEDGEKGELAKGVIGDLYRDRSGFARRAEWVVAPDAMLLEACDAEERSGLAKRLLEVRGELTSSDIELRRAKAAQAEKRTELLDQDVEMSRQRVALAHKGVGIAGEMYEHMRKWRSIADLGLVALVVTTIFSMIAVWYILHDLLPDKKISDVAAPIMIFVLALFAISPAVLLLRERPLEGLDKWSPGGGEKPAEKDKPAAGGKKAAAAKAKGSEDAES